MDEISKKFRNDLLPLLVLILFTVVAYVQLDYNPSVLFACSLALTFYVAADIVLAR